jgi:Ca-activated chloride channel family protein
MMALDVSDSMEIEDMEPNNRMAAAKSVVKNFIKGRVNDRIGLVIFAGESYTRCPLTLDYNVLLESLAAVSPDSIKQGTAIGVALANSVARLKDSTAKSRVVILLTDGENNSGTIDPATATEIAKGYGIKVYTIGIGRDGQTRMPVYTVDAFGRKIKTYQPIHSTVNMTLLDSMAASTGGKSYRAIDTEALKQVFKEIDSLEKSKISTQQYVKFTEVFSPWLLAATILFLMQFFLDRSLLRRLP